MNNLLVHILLVSTCIGCTRVSKETSLGVDDLQPFNVRPFTFVYQHPNESGVLAEYEGTTFTDEEFLKRSGTLVDLNKKIEAAIARKIHISKPLIIQELKTSEFMERIRVVEQFAINRVLYLDAKKNKKPMGNFIKDEFESKIPKATDQEMLSYALSRGFDEDKLKSNPRLKENFENEIFRRRLEIMKREYIRDKLGKPTIVIRFIYPSLKLDLGNLNTINLGSPSAKYVLTLFNGFRCGMCQKINHEIAKLLLKHPDKVRVQVVHFPNVADTEDRVLAEAAQCLGDKDPEYFISTIRSFETVSNESAEDSFYDELKKRSVSLRDEIKECVSKKKKMADVDRHVMMARALGVRSIPLVMINDLTFLGSKAVDEVIRLKESLNSSTSYLFFEGKGNRQPASNR